jgi:uncharacterized SAM-binding protein YcdF (DUF218 family)
MSDPTPLPEPDTISEPAAEQSTFHWRSVWHAMVLGGLAGAAIEVFNLNILFRDFADTILTATVIGGLLGFTRWRNLLWIVNSLLITGILLISYTPLSGFLIHRLDVSDPPARADAIVVLADGYVNDQTIASQGQERLLCAFRLLRGGYAPQLLVTRPIGAAGQWTDLVRREMSDLGLNYPVQETAPVINTHDESLEVARIAREHGWHRVILITQAWHMRRAAALFQKTGLTIIRVPCGDNTYDSRHVSNPGDRLSAFRDWLHETVGYFVYQMRGWI